MNAFPLTRLLDKASTIFMVLLAAFAITIPVLNLLVPAGSGLHVSTYLVALFGKYICYGLLALSIDLIWGYAGILSLGHGAFFALGGYAMGMYLMRQIGARGVYANPILPDFMVFLNWPELPVYWYGFNHFCLCGADGAAGAGPARLRVRLVRVPQPRHRRLSLDHHPGDDLRTAARLLPQQFWLRRQQRADRFQGHPRLQCAGGDDAQRAAGRSCMALAHRLPDLPRASLPRNSARCWSQSAMRNRVRASSAIASKPTSCSCSRCRPAWRALPARSTCRRSASSIRASSRPATRSRR